MNTAIETPLIHVEYQCTRGLFPVRYFLTIGELDPGVPKIIAIAVHSVRWPDGRTMTADQLTDKVCGHLIRAGMAFLGDPEFIRREILKPTDP